MKETAALITALAALVAAIAWPATIIVVFWLFRKQIGGGFDKLPALIERIQKFSVAGVAFEASLDARTAAILDQAVEQPGTITPQQISAAASIEQEAKSLDADALWGQLQRLATEYETLRRRFRAGLERTRAMTSILVKMRTLGPTLAHRLDELKTSSSPGNRLAAVAIMQIDPERADLGWLLDRFRTEKAFILYQSALVLRILASAADSRTAQGAIEVARDALAIHNAASRRDDNTVKVLTEIASRPDPPE